MVTTSHTIPATKTALWTGYTLSGLAIAFLIFDTVIKVLNTAPAVEATTQLGYPASAVVNIGLLELVCLVLYMVPRTAVLGAILMTGYLGGAIATNVRAETPLFNIMFPMIIGALVWGGLFLREPRLRTLVPLRSSHKG